MKKIKSNFKKLSKILLISELKILEKSYENMVGPQDGGFGFDQSKNTQKLKTLMKFVYNAKQVNIENVSRNQKNKIRVNVNTV